jgi:hypothetical protein
VDRREGQAAIDQVAAGGGPAGFTPAKADTIYSLGPNAALWLHYRFAKSSGSRQDWLLEFPLPLLDLATVYQRTRREPGLPRPPGTPWRSPAGPNPAAMGSSS